jgi:hypothetical protein
MSRLSRERACSRRDCISVAPRAMPAVSAGGAAAGAAARVGRRRPRRSERAVKAPRTRGGYQPALTAPPATGCPSGPSTPATTAFVQSTTAVGLTT